MKILLLTFLLAPLTLFSQNKAVEGTITEEISKMDSLLFEEAFNKCNFEIFKNIVVDGIEFYDDRSGLNTDIDKEYASFKDKCAQPFSVTRKLIEHSIHKLGDYGAVQKGTHIFLNNGKVVQSSKFITVWERTKTSWIVKRAISYEHKDL